MPPSTPPIFCLVSASTFLTASLQAATIISCSISTSPATSGSIFTESRFFCPSIWTVTMPPPAVASTLIWAISCWSLSCICCAWRIICCMLPGSFMWLLLEVSNFADLAAEDFAEALHFGVGQRARGGFVLGRGGRFSGWGCDGRGDFRAGFADEYFDAHGPRRDVFDGLVEILDPQRERVGLGGDDLELAAGFGDAGVFDGVGREGQSKFHQRRVELPAPIADGRGFRSRLRGQRIRA